MHYFTMSTLAAALLLVPGSSASAQSDDVKRNGPSRRIEKSWEQGSTGASSVPASRW